MRAAGFEVSGCEIDKNGTIKVLVGKAEGSADSSNEWDSVK